MGQLMSDALSYATVAPGVHASPYGRRVRQRDLNNASEAFTVLKIPSSSVATLKKGQAPMRSQLGCIHNRPISSRIQIPTAFQNT